MKKITKIAIAALLMVAGTALGNAQNEIMMSKSRYAHPQQIQSTTNFDFDKSQYQIVKGLNGSERYVKKELLAKSNHKLATDGNATVTLIFDMPMEIMEGLTNLTMYNKDNVVFVDEWEMSDDMCMWVAEVPQGTYQLIVQFMMDFFDPISMGCSEGIIIKEDIAINQDRTITINYADAKNVVYLEKKLPNGDAFEDGDYDERIGDYINQPNVISMTGNINLIDNECGLLAEYMLGYPESNYIDEEGNVYDTRFRLLVSDLSERYTLIMDHIALGFDDEFNAIYTVRAVKTGINDSEDLACSGNYKTISNSVKPSILCESSSIKGPQANILFMNENEGTHSICTSMYNIGMANTQYFMHVCESGDAMPDNYKYYYNATICDYFYQGGFTRSSKALLLPWGDITGDEVVYQTISSDKGFKYNRMSDNKTYLRSNSTFSFKESEVTGLFGNNAPLNVFGYNYNRMGTKNQQLNCNFVGRMGEIRESDNNAMDFSMSYNGEEVCDDYQLGQNWIDNEEHADGVYDVTIVNQNMTVDDMQGCNTTKVHYDTRNEDFTPPTAMMLQFRNAVDNKVTDRFEAGEEAIMYLAAKDYNITVDENWAMGMECLPVNVKVSYAANGTDNWAEMDINEMPELFDEYSFGYIYATSLDQVMCNSANKWYDLKIELSDEAGNWQEQVISPAFRIERGGSTGIEVVKANDATEVARYTVDGRAISAPEAGVNIVKMSDGTVKKVLVK